MVKVEAGIADHRGFLLPEVIPPPYRKQQPETSWSRSVSETVNGSHEYTVKGYSLMKGMGTGKYVTSSVFDVGGYQWMIYFYPDGKNAEDNSGYVSAFVALASNDQGVRALFELTLVDQSGKGKHKVHSHFERGLESGPYTLKYRGSMWGYKRFYRRTSLETSDFLKDDSLILRCTVGVVRSSIEAPKEISIPIPPSDMGRHLKVMLESGIVSDVVFEVGEETFKAHKLILATRSPVFKAQFFGPIGNPKLDRVVVKDVQPAIFKAMLLYVYSDEIPDVFELTGSASTCTSTVLVQHLMAAADCYGLDRLKLLCESKLCDEITSDTLATTLALAEQYHCIQLKRACLKFACVPGNLTAILKTEGFEYLENSWPSLINDILNALSVGGDVDPRPICRKRSCSSVIGLSLGDDTGSHERGIRRRL